jgi:hypothetical protein
MAGFSDYFEQGIMNLVMCGKAIANIADNAAAAPTTAIWVALHTADPTDSGTQASNEVALTGYTRIATSRSTGAGGWTLSTAGGVISVSPTANIDFPTLTSTSTGTATYASVGLSSSGAGILIASGALSAGINLGLNVIPRLTTASSFTLD